MDKFLELVRQDIEQGGKATRLYRGRVAVSLVSLARTHNTEKGGKAFAQHVGPILSAEGADRHTLKLGDKRRSCYVLPGDWFDEEELAHMQDAGEPGRPRELSDQDVLDIRSAVDELTDEYDVSYGTLASIGYRRAYSDVGG